MEFEITSPTSTNLVSLGQPRSELQHFLGSYRSFRRTPTSQESDQFAESGVIATYSEVGTVTMLEFVDPAHVKVAGVQLLGETLNAVEEFLAATGVEIELDDIGALIPGLSIGLFAPTGVVEGVQLGSD